MSCSDYNDQINLLVDGEFSDMMQAGLYAHLETCSECRDLLDGMLRLRQLIQKDRPPLPEDIDTRLLTAHARHVKEVSKAAENRLRVPLSVAAAAVIVVAVGSFLLGRAGKPEPPPGQTSDSKPALVSVPPKIEILYALPSIEVIGYVSNASKTDSSFLKSR